MPLHHEYIKTKPSKSTTELLKILDDNKALGNIGEVFGYSYTRIANVVVIWWVRCAGNVGIILYWGHR